MLVDAGWRFAGPGPTHARPRPRTSGHPAKPDLTVPTVRHTVPPTSSSFFSLRSSRWSWRPAFPQVKETAMQHIRIVPSPHELAAAEVQVPEHVRPMVAAFGTRLGASDDHAIADGV